MACFVIFDVCLLSFVKNIIGQELLKFRNAGLVLRSYELIYESSLTYEQYTVFLCDPVGMRKS